MSAENVTPAPEAEDAVALGCTATVCLHPRQVPVVRSAYTPAPEAVERARRVLSGELKFDEATVAGHDGAAHDPQQSPTIAEQAYEGHPDSSLNFAMAADGDRNPAR